MNVLIVQLSSLGDVIHTLPAALAVRAAVPEAHLAWVVRDRHAEILRNQPWLDDVIEWRRGDWRAMGRFLRRLRGRRWDVAIDFQGLFHSGAITRLSGARRRIGYEPSLELAHAFYNDRVPLESMDRHAVEQNLGLASHFVDALRDAPRAAEFSASVPSTSGQVIPRFPLHPRPEDLAAVDAWCRRHHFDPRQHHLVVLIPHARRPANRWPAAKFMELTRRLLLLSGVRVALSGGATSASLCDEIAQADDRVWRADGWFNVLAHAALFMRASVIVSGETGLMHVAASVGAPLVALFGPTNPLRTAPYAENAAVLRHELPCAPCLAGRCPLKYDPPPCMESIEVERVLAAVQARLAQPRRLKKSA